MWKTTSKDFCVSILDVKKTSNVIVIVHLCYEVAQVHVLRQSGIRKWSVFTRLAFE